MVKNEYMNLNVAPVTRATLVTLNASLMLELVSIHKEVLILIKTIYHLMNVVYLLGLMLLILLLVINLEEVSKLEKHISCARYQKGLSPKIKNFMLL